MLSTDKKEFSIALREVMSLYGKKADPDIFSIWWNILEEYDFLEIKNAFVEYAKNEKYPPVPAGVIEYMPSAKTISADQAWAHVPKSENDSAYLTQRMMSALAQAQPLIDEGDMTAARMTFRSAYESLPDDNEWFYSQGQNMCYEDRVMQKAVDHKRIESFGWVQRDESLERLANEVANNDGFLLENKNG